MGDGQTDTGVLKPLGFKVREVPVREGGVLIGPVAGALGGVRAHEEGRWKCFGNSGDRDLNIVCDWLCRVP